MDWYHEISRDNNYLVKDMIAEINQDGVKPLGDWRAVYYKGYDGYLVNIVFNLINIDGLWHKDEIHNELYTILKPVYEAVGKPSKEDFNDIVDNIWNCIYEVKGKKYFIKTLARKNMPFWRRLVDNNAFIWVFGLLLILVCASLSDMIYLPEITRYDQYGNLDRNVEGDSFFISILLTFASVFSVGSIPDKKRSYMCALYMPLILAFGMFLYQVIISNYDTPEEAVEAIQICKRWSLVAILQSLWIPVWRLNDKRLNEKKSNVEDMYKQQFKVK